MRGQRARDHERTNAPQGWHTTNTDAPDGLPELHGSAAPTMERAGYADIRPAAKETHSARQAQFHVKHPPAQPGIPHMGTPGIPHMGTTEAHKKATGSSCSREQYVKPRMNFPRNHANGIRRPRPQGGRYRNGACRHDLQLCGDTENVEPLCQAPFHVKHHQTAPLCELSTDDSS